MEFDVESDPETLYELFGKDNADSFAEYALSPIYHLQTENVSFPGVLSGYTSSNGVVQLKFGTL